MFGLPLFSLSHTRDMGLPQVFSEFARHSD